MSNIHEAPRIGELVRYELRKRTPLELIPDKVGKKPQYVRRALARMDDSQDIIPLWQEGVEERRRRAISEARGGIASLAKPYLEMRMTPEEIRFAVMFEVGVELTQAQARKFVAGARAGSRVKPFSPEERVDAKKNTRTPTTKIQENVLMWLDAIRAFRVLDPDKLSKTTMSRVDWKNWVNECLARGYITKEGIRARIDASLTTAYVKKTLAKPRT